MAVTIPPLSFETTLSTLGSNIFLQLVLLYYVKKMPCADAAKPFFLVLSLGMLVGTIGSTAIFVAKATNVTEQIGYYASTVEEFGRFTSLATLLFGGGFHLITDGNSKDAETVSYCAWFIQLAVAVFAVLVTLFGYTMSMVAGGWLTYAYVIMPTIGVLFIVAALLIAIIRACNATQSDDEPCSKSRRLAQLFLFFTVPVIMTVATRGVDGAVTLLNLFGRIGRGYVDVGDILTSTEGWISGIWQVELFFPTAVVLSALIFHPSIRGLCCRSKEKSKVAPMDTPIAAHQPMMIMHPMMTTPQMMMPQPIHPISAPISVPQPPMMTPQMHAPPQMMMIPQAMNTSLASNPSMMSAQTMPPMTASVAPNTMTTPVPVSSQSSFTSQLTSAYQHPVMHGMGGRPVYMMA